MSPAAGTVLQVVLVGVDPPVLPGSLSAFGAEATSSTSGRRTAG